MVQLGDLVRYARTVDEAVFVEKYTAAALIFLAPSARESAADNEPPAASDAQTKRYRSGSPGTEGTIKIKTDSVASFAKKMLTSETQDGDAPERLFELATECEVVFIRKSDRNPFEGMITLGRAPNNDIWIPQPSVSKLHASFAKGPKGWTVTDHKSANGTSVESLPLVAGATSPPLQDGTRIDFGPETAAQFFAPQGLYVCARFHAPVR